MAENVEKVSVRLTNDKVQFTGISESHPDRPLVFDYIPPVGDGDGYTGLEVLLMSLAGCSATTVVYLLRMMGKNVSGLNVNARGIKRDRPPLKFEKIILEFLLASPDALDADVQKVLQLAEASVCPVWQMLKNNVEIAAEYRINV